MQTAVKAKLHASALIPAFKKALLEIKFTWDILLVLSLFPRI